MLVYVGNYYGVVCMCVKSNIQMGHFVKTQKWAKLHVSYCIYGEAGLFYHVCTNLKMSDEKNEKKNHAANERKT